MGKGGGKAPKAPDPAATAAAQTAQNKETAFWNSALNNVNQITPYGNLTWSLGRINQSGQPSGTTQQQSAPSQSSGMFVGPDGRIYSGADSKSVYNAYAKNNPYNGNLETNPHYGFLLGGQDLEKAGFKPLNGGFGTQSSASTGSTYGGMNANDLPQWTSTITLSPEQQAIFDSQNRRDIALGQLGEEQIGRIRDSVSNPYSYAGLAGGFSADDIATQQGNAEQAYFDRLNPQFARDEEALRTRLINQGIGQGSQAYQREMDAFNQMKNDARSQAILAGQTYGSNAQQQALQRRNQAIQEYDAQRNAPLNEYIGLTNGVQVQNPQFQSTGYQGAQPVDYAGLVNNNYQNQMAQYNARQAGSNNLMGSLFGLGGTLGAAALTGGGSLFAGGSAAAKAGAMAGSFLSDARAKENIDHIGEENGFPIYHFNYIGGSKRYKGVMAQDILEMKPEAVILGDDGFYRVNYDNLGIEMSEVANDAS